MSVEGRGVARRCAQRRPGAAFRSLPRTGARRAGRRPPCRWPSTCGQTRPGSCAARARLASGAAGVATGWRVRRRGRRRRRAAPRPAAPDQPLLEPAFPAGPPPSAPRPGAAPRPASARTRHLLAALAGLDDRLARHAARLGRKVDALAGALGHVARGVAHLRRAGAASRLAVAVPGQGRGAAGGSEGRRPLPAPQAAPAARALPPEPAALHAGRRWRRTRVTRPFTRRGRGCSGMGCASTRMIWPPSVLTLARSRVACWYCLIAVLLTWRRRGGRARRTVGDGRWLVPTHYTQRGTQQGAGSGHAPRCRCPPPRGRTWGTPSRRSRGTRRRPRTCARVGAGAGGT